MERERPDPLTDDERRQGVRIDPETGERLRAGVMTRAELRGYLAGMTRRWRAALADPGRRPEIDGAEWVWVSDAIGWARVAAKGKGKAK